MSKPRLHSLSLFVDTLIRSKNALGRVIFALLALCGRSLHVTPVFPIRVRAGVPARVRTYALIATLGVVLLSGLAAGLLQGRANAAGNSTVNFQAKLEQSDGGIAADGNYNVEFKLYDASTGGTNLWTEDWLNSAGHGIRVVNGYLTADLGTVTPFPSTIPWDQNLYITMNIGGTATGSPTYDGEMSPRLRLTAVPYAFQAKSADQLQVTANGFVTKLQLTAPTTSSITITAPNQSGTLCLENDYAGCGFASAAGSTGYIQNRTSLQATANFDIQTVATNSATAVIQALTGQTADLLTFRNAADTANLSGFNAGGQLYYQSGSYMGTLAQATLGQSTVYTLPDPGTATAQFCLLYNGGGSNCAGAGSGITGTGTINRVARFNSGSTINASQLLYDNDSLIGVGVTTGNGILNVAGTSTTQTGLYVTAVSSATAASAVIEAASSQTGNLIEFQDNSGTPLTVIGADGSIFTTATATIGSGSALSGSTGGLNVLVGGGSSIGQVIRAGSAQTGDLLSLQNNSGTVTSGFNGSGQLFYKSGTSTGILAQASLGQSTTYTLPDPGYSTATFCLLYNGGGSNCAGAGSGITGTGANNYVARFNSPSTLVNSTLLYDDGSIIGVGATSGIGLLNVKSNAAGTTSLYALGSSTQNVPVVVIRGGASPDPAADLLNLQADGGATVASFDRQGNFNTTGSATVASGLTVTSGGAAIAGTTTINTTGTANTSIGNNTGTFSLLSSGLKVTTAGALSGITTLQASGAITAATSGNTINGLIINGGALSGITGYTQTSGDFDASGSNGLFKTSTGAVSLNGNTTVSGTGTFTTGSGAVTLGSLGLGLVQSDASGLLSSGSVDRNNSSFLSGTLNVGNGGSGAMSFTANGILFGNGSSAFGVTNALANATLITNASGAPSLSTTLPLLVQGNITQVGALSSGSIATGFGVISTANNISTTATVSGNIINATGTGAAIQLGGADINTAGTLSNVAYLNQSNSFTGATNTFGGAVAVQGSGGLTLGTTSTAGKLIMTDGNNHSLTFTSTSQANNINITIPADTNTTDVLCLKNLANCGTAGAVLGSGSQNYVAKFDTTGSHIANSSIYDDGTFVGINTNSVSTGLLSIVGASSSQSAFFAQNAASATVPAAIIRGGVTPAAGADLLELQDSNNNVLAKFDRNGNLTAGSATLGGTLTLSGLGAGVLHTNSSGVVSSGSVALGTETSGNYTTSVSGGTGITVTGGTGVGNTPSVALNDTTVTANSYGSASSVATFTVDAQGRLTAAASTPIAIATSQITSGDYVASFGTLTGLTTSGNSGTGATPTLAVTYGSTANTAAQGNTTLSFTGSGNLTGTVSGTAGGGFTTNTLALINNPSFTGAVTANGGLNVGSSTALGQVNFTDGTNDGFNATIQLGGAISGNQTYALPTTGGTFCLNTNNCGYQAAGSYESTSGTDFIRNQTAQQTGANFNIQAVSGTVAAKIQGASGQDIADFFTSSNSTTPIAKIDSTGALTTTGVTVSSLAAGVVTASASGVLSSGTIDRNSATYLTGTLSVSNGGTGLSTLTSNGLLYATSANAIGQANGTSGQLLLANASGVPTFTTVSGDVSIDSAGATTIAKLQGNTLTIGGSGNALTTGQYLRYDGTAFVNSGVQASDVTGTLFTVHATSGSDQAVASGNTLNFLAGSSNNLTVVNSATRNVTFDIVSNPSFSGLVTASSNTTAVALTGAPAAAATSSLLQLGSAIVGGNTATNGGTYIGVNLPATGAGSAADFINLQAGGSSKLKITNNGSLTTSGTVTLSALGAGLIKTNASGVVSSGVVDRNDSTYFNTALTVGNGGTGLSTLTANGVLYADTSSSVSQATGTAGQVLIAGASGIPTFTTISGDISIDAAGASTINKLQGNTLTIATPASGQYLRYNGTSFVNSAIQASDVPSLSAYYINNSTTQQTGANFNIQATAATVAAKIQGANGQNIINFYGSSSATTPIAFIDGSGNFSGVAATFSGSVTSGTSSAAGSFVITNGSGQQATIQTGAITGSTTVGFPTNVGASDTFCLVTLANCTSTTGASGTTNYIAKFTSATNLGSTNGNASLFDDGTFLGVGTTSNNGLVSIQGASASQTSISVTAAASATVPVAKIVGGAMPGSGADLLDFFASGGSTPLAKIDKDGNIVTTGSTTTNGFVNNGSTLNVAINTGNFATGGSIGSAASTVDVATSINIPQTTAGQTLTLPSPTTTTAGRSLIINNTGSTSFIIGGNVIPNGQGRSYQWNGSAWTILDATLAGTGLTQSGNTINSAAPTSVVNDTNVTGSIASNVLTLGWTGTLSVARGGTGLSSYTANGLLYASASGTLGQVSTGTAGQFLVTGTSGAPTYVSASGDISASATTPGQFNIDKLQGNTLTIGGSGNALSSGQYLRYNGTAFVNSGIQASDITGTLFSVHATAGSDQTVSSGQTLNFLAGTSNNLTVSASATRNVTFDIVSNPSFSGAVTSTANTTALVASGTPNNNGTSSLLQLGNAISGGNTSANGGTYLGINEPATGAGSAADFVNFQNGNASKFKIDSTGALTVAGTTTLSSLTTAGLVVTNASGVISSVASINRDTSTYLTGTLSVGNGGTGATTLTAHGVLLGNGTGALTAASPGTAGQLFFGNGATSDPGFQTVTGDITSSTSTVGSLSISKLQGNTLTIGGSGNALSSGQYLRYNGTAFVNSGIQASDVTGTLFTLAGSTGTSQNVTAGSTVSIVKGSSNNLTSIASNTNTITLDIVSNPSFSGTVTASNSAGVALDVSGTPTTGATNSLIKIGSAIVNGNAAANGGTYIGINAPATGAGSAADFLNFQANGASKLSLTNAGNLSIAGTATIGSITTAGLVTSNASGLLSSVASINRDTSSYLTGTLSVGNGGTGATTLTSGGLLYGNGTGAIQATGAGTANQILQSNGTNPTYVTLGGDASLSGGTLTINKLQGNTLTISSPTTGQYLRYNGTAFVNSAISAGDVTGTLFTLQGSTGTSQNVTAGSTVSIVKGSSNNLTTTAGATNTITVDIVQNPTFTGLITGSGGATLSGTVQINASGAGATTLGNNGAPLTIANSSATASATLLTSRASGDTNDRFTINADGTQSFGSGSATADVTLARSNGGVLAVTGKFSVVAGGSGSIGLRVIGATGQTANLFQIQDVNGSIGAQFNATGNQLQLGSSAVLPTGSTAAAGKLVFSDGSNTSSVAAKTLTLQATGLANNTTISFPSNAGATDTICLSAINNCNYQTSGSYELTTGTDFIRNQTGAQTGNFNVFASSGVAGVLRGASGQDIAQFQNNANGTVVAKIDQYGDFNGGQGTFVNSNSNATNYGVGINLTDLASSGSTTQSGLNVNVFGTNTSGSNVINGANFANVTTKTNNTFNGLYFGTGYDSLFNYNGTSIINGTGILQSAGLSGTYSNSLNFSNTGNTYSGASATLTGAVQGGSFTNGGTFTVNSSGNVKAVLDSTTGSTFVCQNASGLLSGCTTSPVSASGSNNYVARFTGATTLGTGKLYDDGTTVEVNATSALTNGTSNGQLGVVAAGSTVGLIVKGAASQDIADFENSSSTVVAKVDSTGALTAAGVTVSGFGAGLVTSNSSGVLSSTASINRDTSSYLTGTLSVGNGGTGATSLTTNGILFGNNTNAIQATSAGTNGQFLVAGSGGTPAFASLSGDLTGSTTTAGSVTVSKLQGTTLSISGLASGNFLKYNGTNWVNSAITASDVSGTLFTLAGSTGTSQNVSSGSTVTIAAGSSTNLTSVASATNTITVDIVSNPSFSGKVTSSANTTGLALTGTPSNNGTSSLLQLGTAISNGNNATNGGTYIGINEPASGAGTAADFVNFQNGGSSKFKVDSTGALTVGGTTTLSALTTAGLVTTTNAGVIGSVASINRDTSTYLTGTLSVGNGGTGATTLTSNGVLYGNGTGAVQATTAGTAGQILFGSATSPSFATVSGDLTSSTSTLGALTVSKLQGTTLSISGLTSGQFLKYNGTNWVNSGIAATDVSGTLFTVHATSGTDQNVSGGQTLNFLAGTSTNLTVTASNTRNVTIDFSATPSFTSVTATNSSGTALALSGTPTASASNAQLLLGDSSTFPGNANANGGTYIGVNKPTSGVGSTADFLNFSNGATSLVKVDSNGRLTVSSGSNGGLAVGTNLVISSSRAAQNLTGVVSSGTIQFSGLANGIVSINDGAGTLTSGTLDRNSSTYFNTTLSVANGGTGATSLTSGSLLVGNGTSAVSLLAGTAGQILFSNGSSAIYKTLGGDLTASTSTVGNVSVSALQGKTLTIGATPAGGDLLLYDSGTSAFVNKAITGDVTINTNGVTAIGAGKVTNTQIANPYIKLDPSASNSNLLVAGSSALAQINLGNTVTIATVNNPVFTGLVTASSNTTGLSLSGTPSNNGSSSLLQLGAGINSGNNATNGGTYIGINEPASGAGNAADFLNFQNAGVVKLTVDASGLLNARGGYAVGGNAGVSLSSCTGYLNNPVFNGGILTGGSCASASNTLSLQNAYNNSGTTNPQIRLDSTSGGIKIADNATTSLGTSVPLFDVLSGDLGTHYLSVYTNKVTSAVPFQNSSTGVSSFAGEVDFNAGSGTPNAIYIPNANLTVGSGSGTTNEQFVANNSNVTQTYNNTNGTAFNQTVQNVSTANSVTSTYAHQINLQSAVNSNGNFNLLYGMRINATKTTGANFYGLDLEGTGFKDLLTYNGTQLISGNVYNGSGVLQPNQSGRLQNVALDPAQLYTNINNVGTLVTGSIASGFGTIATANNITTSATIGGGTINGGSLTGSSSQFQVDGNGNVTILNTNSAALNIGTNNPSTVGTFYVTSTGNLQLSGTSNNPILQISSTPAVSSATSLIQIGNALNGANSSSSGTYIGLNAPASGNGSAADLINLQANNNPMFRVTITGVTTIGGATTVGGQLKVTSGGADITGNVKLSALATASNNTPVCYNASQQLASCNNSFEATNGTDFIQRAPSATGNTVQPTADVVGFSVRAFTGGTSHAMDIQNTSGSVVDFFANDGTFNVGANIQPSSGGTSGSFDLGTTTNAFRNAYVGTTLYAPAIATIAGTAPNGITIQPGANSTNSGTGAALTLAGGNETGTTSTGGNVNINGGTGTSTNGIVNVGTSNTQAVNIGIAGKATSINGSLSVAQAVSVNSNTVFSSAGLLQNSAFDTTVNYSNLQKVTLLTASSGYAITGATTAGHYLRNDGTKFVDSALTASDISGTIFNLAGSSGTSQTVSTGQTVTIAKGSSNNLTTTAGSGPTVTIDLVPNPVVNSLTIANTNTANTAFAIQNASSQNALTFDTLSGQLRVYDSSVTSPVNYAYIGYANNTATFSASSGVTQIGAASGNVTVPLTGQNDHFTFTHTYTPVATYNLNDFVIQRILTGGTNSLTGNVATIEDRSTGSANAATVLYLNENNSSATGYLIQAQTTSSINQLTLDTAGNLNIRGNYQNAGNVGITATCTGTNTITAAVVSGGIITGGSCGQSGTLQSAYDNSGNSSTPATITTTSGGKGVLIQAGSGFNNTALFQVKDANAVQVLTVDSTNKNVIIGSATTDTTQENLVLDSYSNATEATTCSSTGSPSGALYYNSTTNAVRACIGSNWEDLVSTSGLGIMLFGVVPDSGANPGDLPALTTTGVTGPCKVSFASATTVNISACTAYSGGRKVSVAATNGYTINQLTTTNVWTHICVSNTGSITQSLGSNSEAGNQPNSTFAPGAPILCLADIKGSTTTANNIVSIFDVRTFTNTQKEFVALNTTGAGLGQAVIVSGSTAVTTNTALNTSVMGVIVATNGSTSTTTPNAIIAVAGPTYAKTTAATAAGSFMATSTTAGYVGTNASVAIGVMGIARSASNTNGGTNICTAVSNCTNSIYFTESIR